MAAPVVVNFQVGGVAQVQQAFRTIDASLARLEKNSGSGARREVNAREREYARMVKDFERGERQRVKDAEKAAKDSARATEREAKEKIRAMQSADRMIAQAHREAQREMAREEAQRNREAMAWLRRREAEEMASMNRARAARERMGRTVGNAVSRTLTRGAASVASGVLSLGGGFSIQGAMQQGMSDRGLAADITQSGFLPHGTKVENQRKRSTDEVLGAAQSAAVSYGFQTNTALAGLQKFVGISGDLDTGMKLLPKFAELARATGSSMDDIAEAAGNVSLNLGGLDKDGSKTMDVLRGMAGQGKLGAVEMRDFAGQIAKISAAAGKFDGDLATNMLKMAALAQEARGEGGAFSASVAANAVTGFTTTLKTSARVAAFQGVGIDVYADKGKTKLKAPEELIEQALVKTGGDQLKMNALFKNIMGDRAVEGFAKRFNEAGGGQKGIDAVRGRFRELTEGTAMTEAEVSVAAQQRSQEADVKFEQAMERLRIVVADRGVPALEKLIPLIEQIIPTVAAMLSWFSENPWRGIGAIVGAAIAKDLAAAGLGKLMEKAFASAGKMAFTIGAAAVAIEAGTIAIDKLFAAKDEAQRADVGGDLSASNTASALLAAKREGRLTPQQLQHAEQQAARLRNELDEKKKNFGKNTASGFMDDVVGVFDSEAKKDLQTSRVANETASMKRTAESLQMLDEAIKKATASINAHAAAAPSQDQRTVSQAQRGAQ